MPDSADKEKARRDEAAFHLVNQWMLLHSTVQEEMRTLFKNPTTCTVVEVRKCINDMIATVNEANSIGIVDPKAKVGLWLFFYLNKLKKIRDCDGFYIPYVNLLLSKIETNLQKSIATLMHWEYTISGNTITESLKHSNMYVEDAKMPLSKKREDGADSKEDEGD